jgi:aspartyl-tRNA(Asn)/glutamyl-tRNA(Gln) amidotransferase subunit A
VATRTAGFGAEVRRRILLGCYCLRQGYADEWYVKAQKVRTLIRRDFDAAFTTCDVLASPTSPLPAFRLGEKIDDPLAMYLCDTLTVPANLAGVPALSVPCGHTSGGLPIGLQLMAGALQEATLLRVAGAYQAGTTHHTEAPAL